MTNRAGSVIVAVMMLVVAACSPAGSPADQGDTVPGDSRMPGDISFHDDGMTPGDHFLPGDPGPGDTLSGDYYEGDTYQGGDTAPEPGNLCALHSNYLGATSPVYRLKQRLVAPGQSVLLTDMVVTAVASDGYFLQLARDSYRCDPDLGPYHSAVFVLADCTSGCPQVGDLVSIPSSTAADLRAARILKNATWSRIGAGAGRVRPTAATHVELMALGPLAPLEAALVTAAGGVVADASPPLGDGDSDLPAYELALDTGLRVDDFVGYHLEPLPVEGWPSPDLVDTWYKAEKPWRSRPWNEGSAEGFRKSLRMKPSPWC